MKYTTASLVAIVGYAAAQDAYGAPAPTPSGSSACPAPGSYDSQGRYSCNPAHAYPNGQQCQLVDGCYFLTQPGPGVSTSSGAAPAATCPAAGSTDSQGRYSCNPAHAYPEGQVCQSVDGCYYLRIEGPGVSTSVSSTGSTPASPTASCPAPGSTDSQGRYSCNPAHAYPEGQVCQSVDGCYYLRSEGPGVSTSVSSTGSTPASPTASCPAPGSTDSKGRYSCNPAHSYPAGQTCQFIDGCPYLTGGSSSAVSSGHLPSSTGKTNSTSSTIVPYTGAGNKAFATGVPIAALALGALFL